VSWLTSFLLFGKVSLQDLDTFHSPYRLICITRLVRGALMTTTHRRARCYGTFTLVCAPLGAVWVRRIFGLILGLLLTAAVLCRSSAAVDVPMCSWPLETTGMGLTNVAYPDTNATYWTMPFDSDRLCTIDLIKV
jgi:hypothetical protein